MSNHVLAFITTAFVVVAFWFLFKFGFLANTESVLIGVIIGMGYHLLVTQGRVSDLEARMRK